MNATTVLLAGSMALLAAAPAFAQMRTSVPSRQAASKAVAVSAGVASGNEQYRPTRFLDVDRAQVLGNGNVVMGLGNGLSFGMGLGNNMEVGFNGGLNITSAPSFSLPLGAYGKMLLANSKEMTMAVGANVGMTIANPFSLNAGIFLPISLWNVGPGNFHVMPRYSPAVVPGNFGLGNLSVALGYELPIMSNWSLHISDTISGVPGNTLTLGSRVALSPNLTADVGTIALNGSVLSINLINLTGYFGGSASAVTKAWGL